MRKDQKHFLSSSNWPQSFAAITLSLILSACSGSVLVPNNPYLPEDKTPSAGNPPKSTAQDSDKAKMIFTFQPDEEVFDDSLDVLFGGQNMDPFDAQSFSECEASLKVKATDIYPDKQETHAKAQLSLVFEGRDLLIQDFKVLKKLIVVRKGSADEIEAEFKALETERKDVLVLKLKRKAANTAAEAEKNSWSGTLSLKKGDDLLHLGRLKGFLEAL